MSRFVTPNGKPISTYVVPNTALWAIKFDQGGSLPERLWSHYTSEMLADRAIGMYLSTLKPKKED